MSNVYMVVAAVPLGAAGCLDVYAADASDPGLCTLTFDAGGNTAQTADIVQVSDNGQVSITNENSMPVEVTALVSGYFQDGSVPTAGEVFVPVTPQQVAANQTVPAGGSVTVQVSGQGGIASNVAGAALSIAARNASTSGYVSVYLPGGTPNNLGLVAYYRGHTFHGLYLGGLSSSGQLTLHNGGSQPVDVSVDSEGYLVSPTGGEAGSTYAEVPQAHVLNTANAIPANSSVTFPVAGVAGIPSSGVSAVVENIRAVGPQNTGYLATYAAGTTPPGVAVNFYAGQNAGSNLTVSTLSATGYQTVTNNSNGTVNVIIAVRGYFQTPAAPDAPTALAATMSGSSATVSWTPPAVDGGAPITGYTVTAAPDGATVTVGGTATSATLSNLANAAADTFSVTAVNQIGDSDAAAVAMQQVLTGTVTSPNGTAVAGDQVSFVTDDGDATSAPVTPSVLGTAVTDSTGKWSFTVPSYASLPADAQASAAANDGYLNIDAIGMGVAVANGNTYLETGVGVRSVWVGTATQSLAPASADVSPPPAMVLRPDGTDMSASYTATAQAGTWSALNNPTMTDSSGNIVGTGANDPTLSAPVDAYGYQEVAGTGSYNPNIAADGTDLTNVPVSADFSSNPNCCNPPSGRFPNCTFTKAGIHEKTTSWTVAGEYHTGWRESGDLSYTKDASSEIGSYLGVDGKDFDFQGYDRFTSTKTLTSGIGTPAGVDNDSRRVFINMSYWESKWNVTHNGTQCYWYYQWDEHGLYQPPGGEYIKAGANIWGQLSKADINAGAWWREDGYSGLVNLLDYGNPHWLAYEPCGWHADLTQGHGVTYGVSAEVGGLGIQAETDHTTEVDQNVDTRTFTCQRRHDDKTGRNDSRHWVWGYNAALIDNPKTFYLY